jgi:hypothetical protein
MFHKCPHAMEKILGLQFSALLLREKCYIYMFSYFIHIIVGTLSHQLNHNSKTTEKEVDGIVNINETPFHLLVYVKAVCIE